MASIVGASRLAAILTLDIKPFLKNSEIALQRLTKFQQRAQGFGAAFGRSLSLAFGLLGAAALKTASNFNEIETQVRAIGGENIGDVIKEARRLGRTTKFTATEVGKLGLELTKMGFDASTVTDAMDTASKISQLFGGSLDKVGTTIAETRRQFRETDGTMRTFSEIGDIFAVAFQNSALDVTTLSGALKNVGSVAKISGYTLERTVALLGALANAGQKGSIGGTRLKTTLIRLGKQFGFTEDNVTVLESGLLDTAAVFDLLKNRAGLAGAVFAQFPIEAKLLEQRLLDAKGALDAMNSSLSKELFISVARVRAGMEDLGITLGDGLAPFVRIAADGIESLATAFSQASTGTKDFIAEMTILGVVVPLAAVAIGSALAAILALASGPGLVVAGLSLLVGIFVKGRIEALRFKDSQENVLETLDALAEVRKDFRDGGSQGDLFGVLSTPALQQLGKNVESAVEDANRVLNSLKDQQRAVRSISGGFAGGERSASRLSFNPKLQEQLDAKRQFAQVQLNLLIADEFRIKKALEKREDILLEKAEEQLRLAAEYASVLGFTVDNAKALTDAFDKTKEKIKEAFLEFGNGKAGLDSIKQVLLDIDQLQVLKDLKNGAGFPTNLADQILDTGTLKEQEKLLSALTKALAGYSVEAGLQGALDLTETLDKAADSYQKLLDKVKKKISFDEVTKAVAKVEEVSQSLVDLGLSTELERDKAQLSETTSALEKLLNSGFTATSDEVKELLKDLLKLQEDVDTKTLAKNLEEALNIKPDADSFFTQLTAGSLPASAALQENVKKLRKEFDAIFANQQAGGASTLEDVLNAANKLADAEGLLKTQLGVEALDEVLKDLDADDALLAFDQELGLVADSSSLLSRQLTNLVARIRALSSEAATAAQREGLPALKEQLADLLEQQKLLEKAAGLTSFLQQQVSFLGDAYLQAAQSGENFFDVLKKSFLDTFNALVAKLITLIALFTILQLVSGGTGEVAGVAKAALGDGKLGSFVGNNLLGNIRSSSGIPVSQGTGSDQPTVKVQGVVSGNNLVIMNQRGPRAFDRTFG